MANRLADSTSPYLLQHKDNPVDWYPWCTEAFEEARRRDVPVLVSVGYAACHWCHVMAHESFEDPETARVMNENFVNVKVDREERPDVDEVLMTAVQAMSGHGGWPMTVFLTPEGKPFFAGTYFPKEPRGGLPAFKDLLFAVSEAYKKERSEVVRQSEQLSKVLRPPVLETDEDLRAEHIHVAFDRLYTAFDPHNGGFGGAPKFPQPSLLQYVLEYHHVTDDPRADRVLRQTLDAMACGGIYDQVGGGFFRYSVDASWRIPHFEKMLYDNAQLIRLYLWAGQHYGSAHYRRIAEETARFVLRELSFDEGAFFSSLDADSAGVEGGYYVWNFDELSEVLARTSPSSTDRLLEFFGATPEGNFEGKVHLAAACELEALGDEERVSVERARKALFEVREGRTRPELDDKVLASWNGLAVQALADLGRVSGNRIYVEAAERCATFVLEEMSGPSGPLHSWRAGRKSPVYFASDMATVGNGCARLYEATGSWKWAEKAKSLADGLLAEFMDEQDGLLFLTPHSTAQGGDHETKAATDADESNSVRAPTLAGSDPALPARPKPIMDGAEPSPSSEAALLFQWVHRVFDEPRYERAARRILKALGPVAVRHPSGFGRTLSAVLLAVLPPTEIVVSGNVPDETTALVWSSYLPTAITVPTPQEGPHDLAIFEGKVGRAGVYVCSGYSCERPVLGVRELEATIRRTLDSQRAPLVRQDPSLRGNDT